MMEKILPVTMHEAENVEAVLGVTVDMDKNKTLQHLNQEYRKWNARATNLDPQIQAQAEQVLNLITQTRTEYVR